jgi:D-psicose/D-tagatose/L-ribulose 3-epimerase
MKLGLINSAWSNSLLDTAKGIHKTKAIGFDTIDIFADPLESDVKERRLIRDACKDATLPVISVVCCALGIADFNASVRRFHIARVKNHLDFAYELEAQNVLLVIGEYVWQKEIITPAEQWNWAAIAVREVGEYACRLGLEIAIELEPFELSIVNTVDKMVEFLDKVSHPSVRANLDISHLTLANLDPEQIAKLKGRIAHVHLSDCDGKKHGDLPPGRGVVDFKPYLLELKKTGYDGTISIELEYSPDPGAIVEWVSEAYRETNKLMQGMDIRG